MQWDGIDFGNSTGLIPSWHQNNVAQQTAGKAATPSSPISIRFPTSKEAQEWASAEWSCPNQNWGVGAQVQRWRTEGHSPGQGCNTWCYKPQSGPALLGKAQGVVGMDKAMTPGKGLDVWVPAPFPSTPCLLWAALGHSHSPVVPVLPRQACSLVPLGGRKTRLNMPQFPLQTLRPSAATCMAPVAACELLGTAACQELTQPFLP